MIAAMTENPLLSEGELAVFAEEGLVLLDRPLTWEIIACLLDKLIESGAAETP